MKDSLKKLEDQMSNYVARVESIQQNLEALNDILSSYLEVPKEIPDDLPRKIQEDLLIIRNQDKLFQHLFILEGIIAAVENWKEGLQNLTKEVNK